jgi:phage tail tape-measure protein
MSWHAKDWFNLAGVLGLGATGFGLAGMGPLAGLLGPAASTVGAGVAGADLAGGLGAGAADEAVGSLAGGTAGNSASIALGNAVHSPLGQQTYGLLKALNTGKQAMGLLNQPPPQARAMQGQPQAQQTANPLASIYPQVGQQNPMDPNYQKYLHQLGYF